MQLSPFFFFISLAMSEKPYYDALPSALRPVHYDLYILDIDVEGETYKGRVTIQLVVEEATDELHLNYRDLSVSAKNTKVFYQGAPTGVNSIEEFKEKEYFVVKFDQKLTPGNEVLVTLDYNGIVQTNMAGLYKSSYEEDGVKKFMLSTQFEATDARRTFPCLDEPALKSTFSLQLEVEKHLETLANTPVKSIEEVTGGKKVVSFEKTPIMSTYLLAWAIGELEYVESFTEELYADGKPLPVRIYTTKGYTADAQFALSMAPKIVDYFSKIFEIKYPLPKLDLLAVHAFSHNAMENWGLITYRSTALLFSETKSDPSYKQKVAYVVAHEIAHQWFGDLVTMQWWDELWLNEGFATWVGFLAVDFLFPEWDIFSVFVSESLQQALDLDGLTSSHPIKVPVKDALEIDELFDAISYLKGGSTILMLANYLGIDVFLKGVAKYLDTHKFGNATSDDLWNAISEVSGEPVNEMMEFWIKRIGFPLINIESNFKESQLKVTQSRYLNNGEVKPEDDKVLWWIPLSISTGPRETDILHIDRSKSVITSKELTIDNFPIVGNEFFKINKDSKGVYRVNYSSDILQNNIFPYFHKLSVKDKIGVIADISSIAISGGKSTSTVTLLELLKSVVLDNFSIGEDYVVWLELGTRLNRILTTFSGVDDELTRSLNNFSQKIYHKIATEMVKSEVDKTDFLKTKLKAEILTQAGSLLIPEVKEYAKKLFYGLKDDGQNVEPSLRKFVFGTISTSPDLATKENIDYILQEVTQPTSLNSREVALSALGQINNDELSDKIISYLIDINTIPIMDSHFLAVPLSTNISTRDKYWNFFCDNYDEFYKHMSTNMVVLDRLIKLSLKNYQSLEKFDQITEFFKDKNIHGFERSLKQALDTVKINAVWYERDSGEVKQWLKTNGYTTTI